MPTKRLPEVVAGERLATTPRWAFEFGPEGNGVRAIACFSATDNLIKGGAGQAVQSMNILLGLDETSIADSGLSVSGFSPDDDAPSSRQTGAPCAAS